MFQADGGSLNIKRAVAAQVGLAREFGVTFAEQTRVLGIDREGPCVVVRIDAGDVTAEHLAVATGSKVCVYDMPPDKEFIVDLLPGDPRITVALGGSGYAGKFDAFLGRWWPAWRRPGRPLIR